MIQVEQIHIQEFRGIRDLRLNMGCKPFLVCGPNGSGKSGVVDALDFVFTGNIARLSGHGSGGLSIAKHGPHVDRRDDPGAAEVSATIRDTRTGATAVLTRNVRRPGEFTLTPDTQAMREAVTHAESHPELILSRREIIKFIITEPGKRSEEVQALLKLGRLGEIRKRLKTAVGKLNSERDTATRSVAAASDAVRRQFDLPTLDEAELLRIANDRRTALGLAQIEDIERLVEGVVSDSPPATIDKLTAIREVSALRNLDLSDIESSATELIEKLATFAADPTLEIAIARRSLLTSGLDLVVDERCPLCGTDWADIESLVTHVREELAHSDGAQKLADEIANNSADVAQSYHRMRGVITAAKPYASSQGPDGLAAELQSWIEDLIGLEAQLKSTRGAIDIRDRLATDPAGKPQNLDQSLDDLLDRLAGLPEPSSTAAAQQFLSVAHDRLQTLRQDRLKQASAEGAFKLGKLVYDEYCAVQDQNLTELYRAVESEFSGFYRRINGDDESGFKAELRPAAGRLDLDVDFYGLGMFPPGAYHSEGHQDGMGVCLYLALVQRLLGEEFQFAVLDDVVMSVDVNHRKQFCALLRSAFPSVQFIVTTHDRVWATQLQKSGLIPRGNVARFYGWTVLDGPIHEDTDFWDKIDAELAVDDVPAAAARLRRNLESIMTDVAASLGAQVTFRPDGNYELGELFAAVDSRLKRVLARAAESANAWNNEAERTLVRQLKLDRTNALAAIEAENWAVNPSVHFNEWADLSKADFEPVVRAWRQFLALFECTNPACTSRIEVVHQGVSDDCIRCACGTYQVNLRMPS